MKKSSVNIVQLFITVFMIVIILLSPRDSNSQEISGNKSNLNTISSEYAFINDYFSLDMNILFNNSSLETLIINDENVSSISPDVKNLYMLKVLDLSNTKVDVLPEELSQLRCLEEIHLNYELWQYRLDQVKRITRAKIVIE